MKVPPRVGGEPLPVDLSAFVGRQQELTEVLGLCARSRLVTLTGPGGVGKTRLAVHAARVIQDAFDDGVYLADLATISEPDLLPGLIAGTLGQRGGPRQGSLAGLAEELGERQVLLVMDNCEHVLEACVELVLTLLSRCAGLSIIAASRAKLGVSGETVYPLPPMRTPEPGLPLDALVEYDAVQLFVTRAGEVDPDFALNLANAAEVAEICRRLEGLPLALELAAARVSVLLPAQIVEGLDDPLELLVRAIPSGLDRHRTIRAALAWSVAQLGDGERRLFGRLGVFPGSWDLDAARAICADDTALRVDPPGLIAELVASSLVQVLPETGRLATRYRLLEVIRRYALELLEADGTATSVRGLHANWYYRLGETMAFGDSQPETVQRLRLEQGNLRAALAWAVAQPEVDLAFSLFVRLHGLWYLDGAFGEARAWSNRVQGLPGGSTRARVLLAAWASTDAVAQGDFDGAQEQASLGLAAAHDSTAIDLQAQSINAWADILFARGELERAGAALEAELRLLSSVDNLDWLHGLVLARLATIALEHRSPAEAERLAREARACLAEDPGVWVRLRVERVFGSVALETDDLAAAERHFASSLAWALEINDMPSTVELHVDLAQVARRGSDLALARRLLRQALGHAQQYGGPLQLIRVLEAVAQLLAGARPQAAVRLIAAAKRRREQLGAGVWPSESAELERCLAAAARRLGKASVTRASTAGRRLDEAAAVGAAFALLSSSDAGSPGEAGVPDELSTRELEVARLVGSGLSNQAIADALVISGGTVRAHVERIRGKLGLRSRLEIAVWVKRADPDVSGVSMA